jgi:hypothetical protein
MSDPSQRRKTVADIFYTVRKIVLPEALLTVMKRYFGQTGNSDYKARHLVDLCMDTVDAFDTLAVYVSNLLEYQNFLSTVFNTKTTSITLFFKRDYWERMLRIQNEHNIGCGDIVRLILASLLFTSGTITLPLERLSRIFISGRQGYTYNMILTRPVAGLLLETEKTWLPINREVIIRASHCYFSAVPDALPVSIPEAWYRVDNETTGWIRQTVTGSQEMKAYFHRLKQSTGKPLSVIIAHSTYSFLKKLREVQANAEQ